MSQSIHGLVVSIAADTKEFNNAIKTMTTQTRAFEREMRGVDALLKKNPTNMALLNQMRTLISSNISVVSKRLAAEQARYNLAMAKSGKLTKEQMAEAAKAAGMTTEEYEKLAQSVSDLSDKEMRDLERAIERDKNKLKELTEQQRLFASDAKVKMAAAAESFRELGDKLNDLSNKMMPFSMAAAAAFAACVKAAAEYEDELSKVMTITDRSIVSEEEMSDGILDISSKYGVAASTVAEAAYQAQSAGIDTANALSFTAEATQLARAGFTDSATTVDLLTTLLNSYGMSADNAGHLTDVLVQTQADGKLTVGELAKSIGNATAMSYAYGVSVEDLCTAYVEMTKQGLNCEMSGTAINAMLTELSDDGSKVAETLKERTGMSFMELMRSGKSLGDVMGILMDSVNGSNDAFTNLWANQRSRRGVVKLASVGVAEYNGEMQKLTNSAGACQDAFDTMENPIQHVREIMETLKNIVIEIGDAFMKQLDPTFKSVGEKAKSLYEAFGKMSDGQKAAIAKTLLFVAALAPLTKGAGMACKGIASLLEGLAGITLNGPKSINAVKGIGDSASKLWAVLKSGNGVVAKVTTAMSDGFSKAAAAMGLSTGALGLVVTGLVALVAVVAVAQHNYNEARKEQEKFHNALSDASAATKAADALEGYNGTLDHAGEAAKKSSKSIDDFRKTMEDYSESQQKVVEDAQAGISTIDSAWGIIDGLIGKTSLTATESGKLDWALQQVNEQFDLNISKQDVAAGLYKDQNDSVKDLRKSLAELVVQKKAEARADALKEQLTNAYKAEDAAAQQVIATTREYNDYIAQQTQVYESQGRSHEVAITMAKTDAATHEELKDKMDEANAAYESTTDDIERLSAALGDNAAAAADTDNAFGALAASLDSLAKDNLDTANQSVDGFMGTLALMGADTTALAKLNNKQWNKITRDYDGSAASIVGDLSDMGVAIQGYDDTPLDDKNADVLVDNAQLVDAQQKLYTWNGSQLLDKDNKVVSNTVELRDAQGRLWQWNGTEMQLKTAASKATGTQDVKDSTKANEDFENLPANTTKTAKVETHGTNALKTLSDWWADILHTEATVTKTLNVHTNTTKNAAGGVIVPHATGGVRLHANGAIFTKPTMISPTDMIGEDGAEYYDGTNIVPLTNRKYALPFASLIAGEVAKRMAAYQTVKVDASLVRYGAAAIAAATATRGAESAYGDAAIVQAINDLGDRVERMQVVLDAKTIAGAVTDGVDRNLGARTRRREAALC